MKKTVFISVLLFAFINIAPQQATAEETFWDKTVAGASAAWEGTKEMAETAAAWTVERTTAAWEVTRKSTSNAAAWTGEKAKKGWQATRKAGSDAADWTREKTQKKEAAEKPTDNKKEQAARKDATSEG